jgi:hypothetical protein
MQRRKKPYLYLTSVALTFYFACTPDPAIAAGIARTQLVDEIQLESNSRTGYEDVVWIRLSGSWPGGVACVGDWGWFNAKDNPQFLATALTAQATGRPLKVHVDDAYPKKDGICEIINLSLYG